MSIDITGLDKVLLLKTMWENSKPAMFFNTSVALNNNVKPPNFNEENAKKAVLDYIDYYDGRCIKTDLSGNTIKSTLYDRDNGQGKLQEIVNNLRNM